MQDMRKNRISMKVNEGKGWDGGLMMILFGDRLSFPNIWRTEREREGGGKGKP